MWQLQTKEEQKQVLRRHLDEITRQTEQLKKALQQMEAQHKALQKRREAEHMTVDAYSEAADAATLLKSSSAQRQKLLDDVDRALANYKLSALSLEQNASKFIRIEILSPYKKRERIASFMQRLIEKGYARVSTKKIELDENLYRSVVEVVR